MYQNAHAAERSVQQQRRGGRRIIIGGVVLGAVLLGVARCAADSSDGPTSPKTSSSSPEKPKTINGCSFLIGTKGVGVILDRDDIDQPYKGHSEPGGYHVSAHSEWRVITPKDSAYHGHPYPFDGGTHGIPGGSHLWVAPVHTPLQDVDCGAITVNGERGTSTTMPQLFPVR